MTFKRFEKYLKPKVIAEIWCNHMWNMDIAKELIKLAKEAWADIIKLQKRDNKLLLTEKQYNSPHPVPANSYWKTYWEHREFLELNLSQNKELKEYCEEIWIEFSTSVWELNSAKEIISLNPKMIKVPSACNNNYEMLKELRDNFDWEVQISFWMTTKEEEEKIIDFFEETNQAKDRLVIYACTSGYPVPTKDVALLEINNLYNKFEHRVKQIWFSGHHLGWSLDIAAYALWAQVIERHFTKDKTWKWTDHWASLDPIEMHQLIWELNRAYEALSYKSEEILDIEKVQRKKLKNKKI